MFLIFHVSTLAGSYHYPGVLTVRREWGLRKLGMNPFWAHVNANSRKGIMAIASSGIMSGTVTINVLKRKGLLSLADHYQLVHSY